MSLREPRSVTITVLPGVLGAAALLGLLDVGIHGRGLDASTSATSVVLWIALAGLPALVLAAVLALAPRGLSAALQHRRARLAAGLAAGCMVLAPLAAAALGAARYEAPALPARAPGGSPAQGIPARDPPHVVLIVLDTLRADHLGAYGGPRDASPSFDALAAQATLFERCFAQAAWTVPSHASLFTGLYPVSHGASFEHARRLDDRFQTLAEWLHESGYRTAAFVANPHLAVANLHQGFELYRELAAPFSTLLLRRPLSVLGGPARWTDEGAAQAVRELGTFLTDYGEQGDAAPLFLFVNLLEPHWRHLPPYAERREALAATGGYLAGTLASTRFYGPLAMARGGLDEPAELAALRALYGAEVRYQDRLLGQLVELLETHLGLDGTLLLVTADHGENLGEGGRFDHVFALNDHLIRVPMLIRYPPRFDAGARRRELCQLVDVPATLRDVLGHAVSARDAGRSLAAGAPAASRFAYAEGDPYLEHLDRMSRAAGPKRDLSDLAAPLRSVRDARYKLVWSARRGSMLFDLSEDADELHDVAAEHPERRDALERELRRWYESQPHYEPDARAPATALDDAVRARLEALGYAP